MLSRIGSDRVWSPDVAHREPLVPKEYGCSNPPASHRAFHSAGLARMVQVSNCKERVSTFRRHTDRPMLTGAVVFKWKNSRMTKAAATIPGRLRPTLDALVSACRDDKRVRSAWLEGSIAQGVADDWSDIDLHLLVEESEAFDAQGWLSAIVPLVLAGGVRPLLALGTSKLDRGTGFDLRHLVPTRRC